MSVLRSPSGGANTSNSGSGSVPDLRYLTRDEHFTSQRKRKLDTESVFKGDMDDFQNVYRSEWSEFKKEITSLFRDFCTTQSETSINISKKISEIKDELISLKNELNSLNLEHNNIKTEILLIKSENEEMKQNMVKLINRSTNLNYSVQNATACDEATIIELQDRCERAKNIIVAGMPEKNIKNPNDRREYERNETLNLFKSIYMNCPMPKSIIRLGKFSNDKTRMVKVCFETPDSVLEILRNKYKLQSDTIKIFSDQTPAQKMYFKNLSEELNERRKNGENDLIIKYIKGIPKIVTRKETKNLKQY